MFFGSYSILFNIAAGGALLLLYVTKKKKWALALGIIVLLHAIPMALSIVPILGPGKNFRVAALFIALGCILIALYKRKGSINFLIPGAILLWMGVCVFVSKMIGGILMKPLFLFCLAAAFICMYAIAKDKLGKWPAIASAILLWLAFSRF